MFTRADVNSISAGAGSYPKRAEENGLPERECRRHKPTGSPGGRLPRPSSRLHFHDETRSVIALGRFQRGAEKDETIVSEMMGQHCEQRARIFQMFSQHGGNNSLIRSASLRQIQFQCVLDLERTRSPCPETASSRFATATAGGLISKPSTRMSRPGLGRQQAHHAMTAGQLQYALRPSAALQKIVAIHCDVADHRGPERIDQNCGPHVRNHVAFIFIHFRDEVRHCFGRVPAGFLIQLLGLPHAQTILCVALRRIVKGALAIRRFRPTGQRVQSSQEQSSSFASNVARAEGQTSWL